MSQIEIEIKSLLGGKDKAEELKTGLAKKGFDLSGAKKSSQLNHYFSYENLDKFKQVFGEVVSKKEEFKNILETTEKSGGKFSIRTRETNGTKVILVIKASLGADTSSNGVTRLEFEEVLPMTLNELDNKLLDCGLTYQAKWSREREEYKKENMSVCIDKNAGYGYLAEFETVTEAEGEAGKIKKDLEDFMNELGFSELPQDRLERMFDFYNKNWADYYGTENIFTIE